MQSPLSLFLWKNRHIAENLTIFLETRAVLRQGLVRLMAEKSIQDITVTELCAACDVNRGTFYLHYTDVFELLHSVEDELLAEFERVLDSLTPHTVFSGETPSPAMCRITPICAACCCARTGTWRLWSA